MEEQNIKLDKDHDEFKKVEEYFFKSMNKERFEVVNITRIQMPREYKTYYFNREYFIEKKSIFEKRKGKDNNEENKFQEEANKQNNREQDKYELYYPFEVKEEEKNVEFEVDVEQEPEEENKEEEKEDIEEEKIGDEGEGDNEDNEDNEEDKSNYIDLCQKGEKFLFYVPRTTLKRKAKDKTIQEYQTISECIEEKGILPIHTKNAEVDNPDWKITHGNMVKSNKKKNINKVGKLKRYNDSSGTDSENDEEDMDDSENEREFDKMTLFGDDASYFTVNTDPENPTMLYSHNEACKDYFKGREHGYRQLLCKVITGIEADYSEKISDEIKDDEEFKHIHKMKEEGQMNVLRMPEYPEDNNNQTTMPD